MFGRKYLIFIIIILGLIYLAAYDPFLGFGEERIHKDTGTIEVHFCPVEDCETIVIAELNKSEEIVCAFYDFDLEKLKEVLLAKNAEVIIFDENKEGYPFTPVSSKGLMHDKFCVLDGKSVITGSMNPTNNGAYKNDNNILIIESELIAQNYLEEFEELRGANSGKTTYKQIELSGILVENYFCPEDDCETEVMKAIEEAKESIHFMTFTFTSDPIGELLVAKHIMGVKIKGVFEARQKSQYWEHDRLKLAGINVKTDANPQTMHHKVFIIDANDPDRATVITGSFNPTKAATTKNDENILIIHDYEITQEYVHEFERIWGEAVK